MYLDFAFDTDQQYRKIEIWLYFIYSHKEKNPFFRSCKLQKTQKPNVTSFFIFYSNAVVVTFSIFKQNREREREKGKEKRERKYNEDAFEKEVKSVSKSQANLGNK